MLANRQGRLTQIKDGHRYRLMVAVALRRPFLLLEGRMRRVLALLAILVLTTTTALASSPERRGQAFAKAHCARCHAIGRTGASRFKPAPPFRTLHDRYPVETLAEAFAEGIYTGHAKMPAFELEPDEINDLLSYLKTLEQPQPAGRLPGATK